METIETSVTGWLERRGITEDLTKLIETSSKWVAHCSPKNATPYQKQCAALKLLFMFYADDGDRTLACGPLDDFIAILEGGAPADDNPMSMAFSEFLLELDQLGVGSTEPLRLEFVRVLGAYRTRNQLVLADALTTEAFFAYREISIAFSLYLALWHAVSSDVLPASQLSEAPRQFFKAAALYMVISNELGSLPRDTERGEANLVLLLANERGITLDQAHGDVKALLAQKGRELLVGYEALLSTDIPERECFTLGFIYETLLNHDLAQNAITNRYGYVDPLTRTGSPNPSST